LRQYQQSSAFFAAVFGGRYPLVCATSGRLEVDCPRLRELPRLTKLIA
jgi:hypothetical protein